MRWSVMLKTEKKKGFAIFKVTVTARAYIVKICFHWTFYTAGLFATKLCKVWKKSAKRVWLFFCGR